MSGKYKVLAFSDFILKKAKTKFDAKDSVHDRFQVAGEFTLCPTNDGITLDTDKFQRPVR